MHSSAPIGAYGTPSESAQPKSRQPSGPGSQVPGPDAVGVPGPEAIGTSEGLLASLSFLRQQADKPPGRPNLCLADFIAPKASGKTDYIGSLTMLDV